MQLYRLENYIIAEGFFCTGIVYTATSYRYTCSSFKQSSLDAGKFGHSSMKIKGERHSSKVGIYYGQPSQEEMWMRYSSKEMVKFIQSYEVILMGLQF